MGHDTNTSHFKSRAPLQVHLDGFDLHAAVTVAAQHVEHRLSLEKLLRYCARPPIARDRLSELPDRRIALQLKTQWDDGSTHIVFERLDLIAKLAALIPRPHKNLVVYHGVLSANSARRSRVVAHGRSPSQAVAQAEASTSAQPSESAAPRYKRRQWAELMRRALGYDLLSCPNCAGKMMLLAVIIERSAIRKILTHLGLPSEPPATCNARASPEPNPPFDHVA